MNRRGRMLATPRFLWVGLVIVGGGVLAIAAGVHFLTGPTTTSVALTQPASSAGQSAPVLRAALSPQEKQQLYHARVSELRARLERTSTIVDGFPKELVDVDALAATLATPEEAFAFVRDRIAFEPYTGVMKGAAGTLGSRGGNAIDRAMLLAMLLGRQGLTARIAHGALPPEQAHALLEQIAKAPDGVEQIAGLAKTLPQPPPLTDVQQRAAGALQAAAADLARARHTQALASVRLVAAAIGPANMPARPWQDAQRRALLDHYWVQASSRGQQVDFDPSFVTASPGQRFAEPADTFSADEIPEALHQRVEIRVVADVLEEGAVTHRNVLTARARTVDLLEKRIRIALEPQALTRRQDVYTVTVTMGDARPMAAPLALRVVPAGGNAAGDLLGGLGGEEPAAPTPQNPAGAVLGRLVVNIVTAAPSIGESRYHRVIMDRLDGEPASPRLLAGMEDDDSVRLLLAQVWDGAVGVGAIQPQRLVANHLQAISSEHAATEAALAEVYLGRKMEAASGASPVPPAVLGLFFYSSLTRHLLALDGDTRRRVYQPRPRIAFYRRGAVIHDWSHPGGSRRMQESLDVVNLPFDVIGDDGSELRVKLGIADAALERAFASRSGDFNTVPLVDAANTQKIPFVRLTSADAASVAQLAVPSAIKGVLRDALDGGRTLIAPSSLTTLNQVSTFGWWSIDPESGVPLGQMELGAGQAVSETAALNKAVLTGAHTFSKFYGGMLGCFYVEAADQLVPPDEPYHLTPTFNWSQGHLIPGLPTVASGQGLAACLVDRVCEAVVEYAFLAAESAAWMADLHGLQHLLVELLGLAGPTAVSNWMGACEGGEH